MVPFWVPIIIRGLIRGLIQGTQKGTIILTVSHIPTAPWMFSYELLQDAGGHAALVVRNLQEVEVRVRGKSVVL